MCKFTTYCKINKKKMKKNCTSSPKQMTQQTFCNNPFYKKNVRNNRKYTNLSMKNNIWYGFILNLSKKYKVTMYCT